MHHSNWMGRISVTRLVAVAALALLSSTKAIAFEAHGYRVGMTVEEVRRLAGQMQALPSSPSSRTQTYFSNRGTPGSDFAFCDGRLYRYTRSYPATVQGFLAQLAALTQAQGAGVYAARDIAMDASGPGGRWRDAHFYWQNGRYLIQLKLIETTGERRISNLQQIWHDTGNLCGAN